MEKSLAKRKLNIVDLAALICFIAAFVFLYIRSGYGFGIDDESLYLSVPYRLIRGDSLLTDEWHVSQLLGFVLYIPVKLYLSITGSTEGILLFFRHLFVIVQAVVSAMVYLVLRKNGKSALFAMLIFMLHVHMTYFVVNYYTVTILSAEIICFILYSGFENKKFLKKFLVGFFLSAAVLGEPFLAVPVIFYALICFIKPAISKTKFAEKYLPEKVFSIKTFTPIFLGILPLFITFTAFVLSRTTIKKILQCLPMIFKNPEYTIAGKGSNVITAFSSIFTVFKVSYIGFVIFAVIFVLIARDKKRMEHRKEYFLASFAGYIVYIIEILVSRYTADLSEKYTVIIGMSKYLYWMMSLAIFSLICYLLTENKKKILFYSFWLVGLVTAIFIDISSDIGPRCSTSALAISDTAGIIFIFDLVKEIKSEEDKNFLTKIASCVLALMIVLQLGTQIRILADVKGAAFEYASESKVNDLSVKIDKGPAKGLLTTKNRNNIYNQMISDLDVIKEKCNGRFLIAENYPWAYLYMEKDFGTFSEWFLGYRWDVYEGATLRQYCEINPDKMPEYIYVTNRTFNYSYEEYLYVSGMITEDLNNIFDCEIEKLSDGYMVHVLNLK